MNPETDPLEKWLATALLLAVLLLSATDLYLDLAAGTSIRHAVTELLVILASGAAVVALWLRTALSFRLRMRQSERDVARLREEAARWEREAAQHLEGLSRAIDEQMARWGLSGSEQEVARLLLKGLSLKEIAAIRAVSEKTVRHQSLAIYRKSGLGGRADLAAFFLEDLLTPAVPGPQR